MFLKSSLQAARDMRTKKQQATRRIKMLTEIKDILNRSRATLIEDVLGMVSLFSLLFVGLYLSGAA
jgi:hypothetical protein